MICPNCNHENPESAKFCNACGSPLAPPVTPEDSLPLPPPFVSPASASDVNPQKKKKKGFIIVCAIVVTALAISGVGAGVHSYLESKRESERVEEIEEEFAEFKDHVADFCANHESISLYNYSDAVRTGSIYDASFYTEGTFSNIKFKAALQKYTNGYIEIEGDPDYSDVLKITVTYGDYSGDSNEAYGVENWDYYEDTGELVFRSQSKP